MGVLNHEPFFPPLNGGTTKSVYLKNGETSNNF